MRCSENSNPSFHINIMLWFAELNTEGKNVLDSGFSNGKATPFLRPGR
jgi:hypothetical protein